MPGSDFTVDLVDDDVGVLQGLHRLLCAAGFAARCFSSAEDFLASHDPSVPGCVILDVGLSKWNGLAVQEIIANADGTCPVIFLTGSSDVPTSVRAMKAGAVDFLTKPVQEDALFQAIARAQALDSAARRLHDEQRAIHQRLRSNCSPRERQVLAHVVAGRLQQADCRGPGHGRKDHQGPPRADDEQDGRASRRGARSSCRPRRRRCFRNVRGRQQSRTGPWRKRRRTHRSDPNS